MSESRSESGCQQERLAWYSVVRKVTVNASLSGGFMTVPNWCGLGIHPEVIDRFRAHTSLGAASRRILGGLRCTRPATPRATRPAPW
jgi:hypothetical protein